MPERAGFRPPQFSISPFQRRERPCLTKQELSGSGLARICKTIATNAIRLKGVLWAAYEMIDLYRSSD